MNKKLTKSEIIRKMRLNLKFLALFACVIVLIVWGIYVFAAPNTIMKNANICKFLLVAIISTPVCVLVAKTLISRAHLIKKGNFVLCKETVFGIDKTVSDNMRIKGKKVSLHYLVFESGKRILLPTTLEDEKYPIGSKYYILYVGADIERAYYIFPCDKYELDQELMKILNEKGG